MSVLCSEQGIYVNNAWICRTFTSALLKVKEEMESSAQDHAALGEAIRRELETPLAEFIDYQCVISISHYTENSHA